MPRIRKIKFKDKKGIQALMKQLTENPANVKIKNLINDKYCHCLVMEHNNLIIGFGSLIIHQVPTKGYVARIEDVIVHEAHRGKGHGRKITEELILIATKKKIKTINLTSHPKRVEARKLYQSMGFELLETGVFKLDI